MDNFTRLLQWFLRLQGFLEIPKVNLKISQNEKSKRFPMI